MNAAELPPGVVAAPKAGVCSRCGEPYPAGTHARRYSNGLRPVACGCHPVEDRAQTAPARPAGDDPWDRAAADLGADHDTLIEQIATLARDLDHERRVHRGVVVQFWRALNPNVAPTPEWHDIVLDELLVRVQDLEADAATYAPMNDQLQADLRVEKRRAVSLQGQAAARERDLAQCRTAQAEADRARARLHARVAAALGLTRQQAHLTTDDELVQILERTPGALDRARGGQPSEPASPDGGAPAAATPTPSPPSATTPPPAAPLSSSPTPAVAAPRSTPRSTPRAEPPRRSIDDVPEYSTPSAHVCGVAGCGHRQKFHDDGGCTVRRCSCTGFKAST